MLTFEYKGYDASGRRVRGLIEALDPKDARERLSRMGILPRHVESLREGKAGGRERPMKLEERSMVYHELGALLAAGLPMDRALDILVSTPEMAPHATALARFRDAVRDGAGVHEAVHRLDPAAGAFEQAMLQAGEASGRLPSTLGQVASYLEEERTLRENIVSSLLYPFIVVMLALIAVVVISLVLFPTFQTMLREFGVKEPPLTRIVMGGGRLMAWVAPLLLGAVVVLGLQRKGGRWKQSSWPGRIRRRMLGLPGVRDAYRALVNLRFSRAMSLMLDGGVSLVDAFQLAGKATGDPVVSEACTREAEAIRHGVSPADALHNIPILREALPGWMRAAEATGDVAGLLKSAADRFRQQWQRTISRLLSLLEPAVILAVGVAVLLIALAILLPMMSLNRAIL